VLAKAVGWGACSCVAAWFGCYQFVGMATAPTRDDLSRSKGLVITAGETLSGFAWGRRGYQQTCWASGVSVPISKAVAALR
jgi:hypothetical protein